MQHQAGEQSVSGSLVTGMYELQKAWYFLSISAHIPVTILSYQVSWFPKAFSVIPQDAKNHAGVLTSFVLHFVAFTGHSLELYRVVTLSESLHTAKMILDKSSR